MVGIDISALEVGLPMSKFQVDRTKNWILDFPLKVMLKYKILGQ